MRGGARGLEKAPVEARWSDSKIFWSSSGSRGGAGPPKLNGLDDGGENFEESLLQREELVLIWRRRQRQLKRYARGAELLSCRSEEVAGFMVLIEAK